MHHEEWKVLLHGWSKASGGTKQDAFLSSAFPKHHLALCVVLTGILLPPYRRHVFSQGLVAGIGLRCPVLWAPCSCQLICAQWLHPVVGELFGSMPVPMIVLPLQSQDRPGSLVRLSLVLGLSDPGKDIVPHQWMGWEPGLTTCQLM